MDPVWLALAYLFGLAVRRVGLPPLVGFLAAGFALHAYGVESTPLLGRIADAGVTLLLFSIGVKLKLRDLGHREVWGVASVHALVTTALLAAVLLACGLDVRASLVIAFGLSFSSTVFVIKLLDASGGGASLYGRTAVGILIMQDVLAVGFLALAAGETPTPWALLLLPGVLVARPLLLRLLTWSGHGELLLLLGVLLTLGGYGAFEAVGVKGDLGAIVAGVLVSSHRKASELGEGLLGFKDLFLVGFFLKIGLEAEPTLALVGTALLLVLAVPVKIALFFGLLTLARLRARTSWRASLLLGNYSEFGLIVASVGVASGWIGAEWLVVLAVALSATFLLGTPLNLTAPRLYIRHGAWLRRAERVTRHPEEMPIDLGASTLLVVGMGRIGTGAYDELVRRLGDVVVGIDVDPERVAGHAEEGRRVVLGDATDPDFLARVPAASVEIILLALPKLPANLAVVKHLRASGYAGQVTALGGFDDHVAAGVYRSFCN